MSGNNKNNQKFSDNGASIYEFGDEFLVVCPRCASLAKVLPVETTSEKLNTQIFAPHRLVCLNCVYRADWNGREIAVGGNFDWYFQLPLWLETECCGKTLWAYNEKHLNLIEDYVSAKLRERMPKRNRTLASCFPKWIKSAKNRDEILRTSGKLRAKLNGKS